jgi:N-acetylglucosaminyldiphosphoundecaprenol N-acetyl-beta-D-mannosaminyltransferase
MEAQRDPAFRNILKQALLVTPDGMPTVWVGRRQGFRQMERVFGPDLMYRLCAESVARRYTHFLYGGNAGVAEKLKANLERWFPGIRVLGTYTPPFRWLSPAEEDDLKLRIRSLRPDLMWIGLSTPKQEHFMSEYLHRLDATIMLGVGAAFDLHTGRIKDAPEWIKRAGLQWLHRVMQDPARLWKRYLVNNTQFVWKLARQSLTSGGRR